MLRLVIPVDGSEASLRAIDTALRLAKETAVEAVLVHVREGVATYHGDLMPREYERIGEQARSVRCCWARSRSVWSTTRRCRSSS
jgi:nucleotide-binding universal stress UspA family protein